VCVWVRETEREKEIKIERLCVCCQPWRKACSLVRGVWVLAGHSLTVCRFKCARACERIHVKKDKNCS